ncbi:hypothetical protein GUITHDRAFT_122506 [Guillardia theta CCMP2712]|uniref:Uncharacterized protein n=1 Tax=Guillardia theta (strain CCMP2712) TaxID=905079 RepID=L1I4W2_GUITC|nr:hypothetical protein GUITHDRAFT_122506 [Guillardia theta CCMP2712]EKX31293.1 hypothetical protein GUITHDRAFT_122506 [Guillardia theta CCMP2712]|eukprot:XP_005818273.1 hypothetical protein GUITHDRAFT_122506 [Guillardia theta CCMP2712]
MSNIRIVKRKAKGFFKSEDLVTIKDAVKHAHRIMSDASILIRSYYLRWFQSSYPLESDGKELELEHFHISMACSIVQGITRPPVRGVGPERSAKITIFNDMLDEHKKLYERLPNDKGFETDLSLSHILAYSIDNLLTAYKNNIETHFLKYTKRYILCDMLAKNMDKSEARRVAAIYTNVYMYDATLDLQPDLMLKYGLHDASYSFLFPPKIKEDAPRVYDLKANPWVYLPKMVMINQALETDFLTVMHKERRLLNPLPFYSSFVPMHIRIDTSGLSQLLMTKDRIDDFKRFYLAEFGVSLNISTKANMLASFEKIFGRKATSNREAGLYATEMWSFLTNLKTCRQWKELDGVVRKNDPKRTQWMFDNAVVTDGVSISFQVIDNNMFGRKVFSSKKKATTCEKDDEQDSKEVTKEDLKTSKLLGCDPGKRDILAITDGVKTICYTKGQRDMDTHKKTRLRNNLKRRRGCHLEAYETQVMNRFQKRSCHPEMFQRYACSRKRMQERLLECYSHPVFREFKFLVYNKTKSSEHRFMHRVFTTFKQPQTNLDKARCASGSMRMNALKEVHKHQDITIGWDKSFTIKKNTVTYYFNKYNKYFVNSLFIHTKFLPYDPSFFTKNVKFIKNLSTEIFNSTIIECFRSNDANKLAPLFQDAPRTEKPMLLYTTSNDFRSFKNNDVFEIDTAFPMKLMMFEDQLSMNMQSIRCRLLIPKNTPLIAFNSQVYLNAKHKFLVRDNAKEIIYYNGKYMSNSTTSVPKEQPSFSSICPADFRFYKTITVVDLILLED